MAKTITELLSEYLQNLKANGISAEAMPYVKDFFCDTFYCLLAGAKEKPAQIAAEYAAKNGGKPEATVIGSHGFRTDAENAALINGISAHFHDYDDVCTTMVGHPSVAVLPAVLALGETEHISGKEALAAYDAGIEICALMGRLLSPEHNQLGWHSTQSLGVFGATAAAAFILGLNYEETVNALGIAASESSGLKANYGSMTKPYHAGRAAQKGIKAARLAKLGFTSRHNVIEAPDTGFIKAAAGTSHIAKFKEAVESLQSEFVSVGLIMKPWPSCKATHNGLCAMLDIMHEHGFTAKDVKYVNCRVMPFAKDMLQYLIPNTPTEGKFSMIYCMAKIVLNQKLTMKDFEGTTVDDPELMEMMRRIDMTVDDQLFPGQYYNSAESVAVDVELYDGSVYTKRCDIARGSRENPMTEQEKLDKAADCLSRTLVQEGILPVIEKLKTIEDEKDIGETLGFIDGFSKGTQK